jgi:hypothetical protein
MQEAIEQAVKEVNASDEFEERASTVPLTDGYSYGLCGPETGPEFSSTEMVLKTAFALDRGALEGMDVDVEPEPTSETAIGEQHATTSATASAEEGLGNLVIDEDATDMDIGDEPTGPATAETEEAQPSLEAEGDSLFAEIVPRDKGQAAQAQRSVLDAAKTSQSAPPKLDFQTLQRQLTSVSSTGSWAEAVRAEEEQKLLDEARFEKEKADWLEHDKAWWQNRVPILRVDQERGIPPAHVRVGALEPAFCEYARSDWEARQNHVFTTRLLQTRGLVTPADGVHYTADEDVEIIGIIRGQVNWFYDGIDVVNGNVVSHEDGQYVLEFDAQTDSDAQSTTALRGRGGAGHEGEELDAQGSATPKAPVDKSDQATPTAPMISAAQLKKSLKAIKEKEQPQQRGAKLMAMSKMNATSKSRGRPKEAFWRRCGIFQ